VSSGTWLLNVLEEHSRSIFTGNQKVVVVVGPDQILCAHQSVYTVFNSEDYGFES